MTSAWTRHALIVGASATLLPTVVIVTSSTIAIVRSQGASRPTGSFVSVPNQISIWRESRIGSCYRAVDIHRDRQWQEWAQSIPDSQALPSWADIANGRDLAGTDGHPPWHWIVSGYGWPFVYTRRFEYPDATNTPNVTYRGALAFRPKGGESIFIPYMLYFPGLAKCYFAFGVPSACIVFFIRAAARRARQRSGRCVRCGYPLLERRQRTTICSECGQQHVLPASPTTPPPAVSANSPPPTAH